MSNAVSLEGLGRITLVRFIRPERRNPLSREVVEELARLLPSLEDTPLIFTGSDGVFASGADLREIAALDAADAPEFARMGQRLMQTIADRRLPSAAAVNGPCFGGALDLALACTYRTASPAASFAHPGTGLGIITGWGGTQRLPRLIGQAVALEMFFTAAPINAARAAAAGLVDDVSGDPVRAAMQLLAGDQ
jgi:enoyl-CoA hydratase